MPDVGRFPGVSNALLASMRREGALVFADLVRRNRSVRRLLLDDDFTFMNGKLAAHNGYDDVREPGWRRVRLRDASRGGLLTQAAVLTVSSSPKRTSPVFRGKWIPRGAPRRASAAPAGQRPAVDRGGRRDGDVSVRHSRSAPRQSRLRRMPAVEVGRRQTERSGTS